MNCVPGILSALERCLLEVPGVLSDTIDSNLTVELLGLLESTSLLLLGVLYGCTGQDNTVDQNGNVSVPRRED